MMVSNSASDYIGITMESAFAEIVLLQAENAELKAWQESARSVTPPLQQIAKELDLPLGASIHDKILPGIQAIKSKNAKLRACVELYADTDCWSETPSGTMTEFSHLEYFDRGYEPAQKCLEDLK